jgi:glycine betaine catabolism B
LRYLFGAPFHFGGFYLTSETALVLGNAFSFIVSPKRRLFLKFYEKRQLAPTIFEFAFDSNVAFKFLPGQYLEWTLPHRHVDSRGNRRYFTIVSSPTENRLRLAAKIIDKSSSYKRALLNLKLGESLAAGELAGEFTIPRSADQELVFIAGGIGITPFRSMIKYIIDKGEERDVTLFYSCSNVSEFVYREIFEEAVKNGLKVVYVLTDVENVPPDWKGKVGFLSKEMIQSEVRDYENRTYYLSGPQAMVTAYKRLLKSMGIGRRRVKTDYFPGY